MTRVTTKTKPVWAVKMIMVRKYLSESQETFGKRFGVTKNTVSLWERGRFEPPAAALIWVIETYARVQSGGAFK